MIRAFGNAAFGGAEAHPGGGGGGAGGIQPSLISGVGLLSANAVPGPEDVLLVSS